MDTPQPTKMSSTTAWIILIVIIIILGVGAYFFLIQEEETNFNINITKNINSVVNENVNGMANINTTVNINTVSNTNTAIDTSDWLTYENEDFDFSLTYPSNWEIVNNANEWGRIVGFRNSSKDVAANPTWSSISITYAENPSELSICDYYKLKSEEATDIEIPDYCTDLDFTNINVSGLPAVQFSVVPGVIGNILTSVIHENKIFSISMGLDNNRNDVIYNNIVESFQFTNTTDTTDWLTYENEEWGFSIKHPFDWTDSIYGQMINISPKNVECWYEGGVAYPIYFTFDNESAQDRLQNIEDDKKTVMEINSFDTVLIDGYFLTSYYIVDVSEKGGSLTINDHIEELQQAGNYDSDYASELSSIFKTILSTFELL